MFFSDEQPIPTAHSARRGSRWFGYPVEFARRFPFLSFFLLGLASNAVGSVFNIVYNKHLIVDQHLDPHQDRVWHILLLIYNVTAYPFCLGLIVYLLIPLSRCLKDLHADRPLDPEFLEKCRRRLVNLPAIQVGLNFLGWMPGAVIFPLAICVFGGWHEALPIWWHFVASFTVSALLTTMQTFFLLETFLLKIVYPDFFRDARPAEVQGAVRIPLRLRLFLYWMAVAVVPLLALLVVALDSILEPDANLAVLLRLSVGVFVVGILTSGLISFLVGRDLRRWVDAHLYAIREVARGNYDYRIPIKRPDKFGIMTDSFNDMNSGLGTFGQFIHETVAHEILHHYTELGGQVEEITVMFADIRGFTRRSAGEPPERSVDLLNRFLSLALQAVEEEGGWVDKFLGDGIMALFGAPLPGSDHPDQAVRAGREMLARLQELNRELDAEGQEQLAIGVGINTGPALVGCVGATRKGADGKTRVRRGFTAIGETVNLAQRIEQMTKTVGGPLLISKQTHDRLQVDLALQYLGPQPVPGTDQKVEVYRVLSRSR